ncbi:MAG: Fe-S cluster assembly protein SufD, partial [bacterium]
SHEMYKAVLDDHAKTVFNGRILVRKDAQKTDSKQTNKNLLLSDTALVNTNPQLEIYADDVKCTHGATIGQLDESMIFYLRSRGIGAVAAEHLLTYAFANDIVGRIQVPALRESLNDYLVHRLRDEDVSEEVI